MKQMTKAQLLTPVLLSLAFPVVALEASGCKKDEPPPPLPSAAPAAVTPPPAASPIELVPEVPVASASASASAAPVKTGGGGGGSLKACCNALRQNAASAPEPNKGFMLTAAQICDGAAAAGQTSAMGPITAALRGAGLPTACK
jgi:hypothetical protein